MRPGRPAEILLIDNGAGDTRQSLQDANLHVTDDGGEALRYLRRQGKYQGAPAADLVLLELGARGLDGQALLAEIKRDPALARIPVIVLGSNEEAQRAYDAHANCFITKPPDPERFAAAMRSLQTFWLQHAILPPPSG